MASTRYTKLPKSDPQTWVTFGERNIKWIIMQSLTLQTHVVCVQGRRHYEDEVRAVSRCGLAWPYQCASPPRGRRMCVGAKTHDILPCPKHLSSMPQQYPDHVSSVFQTCPDHVPEHVCFSTRTLCLVGKREQTGQSVPESTKYSDYVVFTHNRACPLMASTR